LSAAADAALGAAKLPAGIAWQAEPPKLAAAERLAGRWVVRNGVADVVGVAHAPATYVAGVFAWSARAPDALACVACPSTARAPLLCDDALHVLCESCAPDATGRPRCRACRK
jgi:hypothetical protein